MSIWWVMCMLPRCSRASGPNVKHKAIAYLHIFHVEEAP